MKPNDIEDLKQQLAAFAAERDWDQFHSPKNLAMALIGEAAEITEIFQWLTEAESHQLDSRQHQAAREELADVFIYLIRLADKLDIDLVQATREKMQINAERYPAERVKGSAKRASEYLED